MKKNLIEFCVHNAMIYFLYGYEKRRYGYGTLQEILRELSPLPEGGTSNPAIWEEWKRCVSKSLEGTLETEPSAEAKRRTYTKLQAFNTMVDFFIDYYKRTLSGNLRALMKVIYSLAENNADQTSWNDWNSAVKKALQKQAVEKPLDKTMEKRLTKLQAFNAMVKFLDEYYEKTASDFMGGVLGCLSFTVDGSIVDAAFWEDWSIVIKKILREQNNKKRLNETLGISLTEPQAFKAMVQLFRNYFEPDPDDPAAITFFNYLHLSPGGNSSGSSTIKEQWKQCIDNALKEKPGIRKYRILCRG